MGWTYEHATHYNAKGKVDRKAEAVSLVSKDYKVLKAVCKSSVVYMAIEDPNGDVFGNVVLTSISNYNYFNFGSKFVSEDMGPNERECPDSILNLLTPTESEWANEWRNDCRKYNEQKKAEKKSKTSLSNLPIGAVIRVKYGTGELNLVKHAPGYQFKRSFWQVEGTHKYMPSTRIKEYDVITC